jgi:hypothetical protein
MWFKALNNNILSNNQFLSWGLAQKTKEMVLISIISIEEGI